MVQVPWALYPLHHLPVNQSLDPLLGAEPTPARPPDDGAPTKLEPPVLPGRCGTTFIRWGRPQLPHLEHPPLVPQAQRPEASEGAQ